MITRKWAALAVALTTAVFLTGLKAADDAEDPPLLAVMKQVNLKNAAIQKGVRSAANYKKSADEVAKSSADLVKLLKEAKPLGQSFVEGPRNTNKATMADWDKLMDDCIKKTDEFAAKAAKPDAEQKAIKTEFATVSQSCTACHDVFRIVE